MTFLCSSPFHYQQHHTADWTRVGKWPNQGQQNLSLRDLELEWTDSILILLSLLNRGKPNVFWHIDQKAEEVRWHQDKRIRQANRKEQNPEAGRGCQLPWRPWLVYFQGFAKFLSLVFMVHFLFCIIDLGCVPFFLISKKP